MREVLNKLSDELGVSTTAWRVVWVNAVIRHWPEEFGGRLRARLYRWAGVRIGERTAVRGVLPLRGGRNAAKNLFVGANCLIYAPLSLDCCAPIHIGDCVTLGPSVTIVTGNHQMRDPKQRAGKLVPQPVFIEDGVWICLGATILPGVTIGAGAVVGAGAMVTRDVAPNTIVAGNPARVIRSLELSNEPTADRTVRSLA